MFKIAIFVLTIVLLPFAASGQDNMLNILYTGSIKGELEPCGCSPKTRSGGLARLSGYISANGEDLKPYILVDAGNSMGEGTPQGRLKTEALLRSFGIMGYVAVALSETDLHDADFLASLIEKNGIPTISGKSRRSVLFEQGTFRVNVGMDPEGYKRGSLNILLTDRPASEAGAVKGWDVIVTSSGETLEEPLAADGTIIVSGYPKGKKLGVLSLSFDENGRVAGFMHRWQELGEDVVEDREVRSVLDEYDARVAELLRKEEARARASGPYLGVSTCAKCHQPFVESWLQTRHAGAFGSLERVGKSMDPECIKCHSTGHGEEGGFYSLNSTPGLANVQCEVCHGPGKEHVADFTVTMNKVGRAVCLRCHTKDNSPDFDYGLYIEKIKHW